VPVAAKAEAAAAEAEEEVAWAASDPASVRSAVSVSHTSPARRVSMSAARTAEWPWFVKVPPTTRRSRIVAQPKRRRAERGHTYAPAAVETGAERRTRSCREEKALETELELLRARIAELEKSE